MSAFPLRHTVQLVVWSAGVEDAHGNAADVYADPVDHKVYGWGPAGAPAEPAASGRNPVLWDLDVYAPPEFPARAHDRMIVGGVLYDVEGHPEDFTTGPFGFFPGMRVSLKRVEG